MDDAAVAPALLDDPDEVLLLEHAEALRTATATKPVTTVAFRWVLTNFIAPFPRRAGRRAIDGTRGSFTRIVSRA